MNILIDEGLPRTLQPILSDLGFQPYDVRNVGLRGANDEVIFHYAQSIRAAVITEDLDFIMLTRLVNYYLGLILVRIPSRYSTVFRLNILQTRLREVKQVLIPNNIIIIESSRVRYKRKV